MNMGLGLFRKWAVFGRTGDWVKGSRGLNRKAQVVHTSVTPGPFRERHAHKAYFFFFSLFFFVNIVKRTHQVWSWNAMLGPILKHHAMGVVTASKPSTFFVLRIRNRFNCTFLVSASHLRQINLKHILNTLYIWIKQMMMMKSRNQTQKGGEVLSKH